TRRRRSPVPSGRRALGKRRRCRHSRVRAGHALSEEGGQPAADARRRARRAGEALHASGAVPGSRRAVPEGAEERSQGPDRALSPDPGATQDGTERRDPRSAEEARPASRRGHQGGKGALSVQADRRRSGGKAGAAVAPMRFIHLFERIKRHQLYDGRTIASGLPFFGAVVTLHCSRAFARALVRTVGSTTIESTSPTFTSSVSRSSASM